MAVPRAGSTEETPTEEWCLEDFGSLNTKVPRPAVAENEFSWNENWIPIATGRMRTLYAEATSLYTASGKTIIYTYSYVLLGVTYWAVFFSDGTAIQINQATTAVMTISSTANTFYNSGVSTQLPQCSQFQNKYLAIVNNFSNNGYWLWDGTNLYSAGTISPDYTVTNAGSGYTSTPTVSINGGSGSGASATATVKNGAVTAITVTNPGSGYLLNDQPVVTITGGGSDNAATATATIHTTTGGVSQIFITAPGSNYGTSSSSLPTISFSGGSGSGAQAVVTGISAGAITSVAIVNPGSGYTSAPSVSISGAGGSGCTLTCNISTGGIGSVSVGSGGTGYVGQPTVTVVGDGTGATLQAVTSGGAVTAVNVVNAGQNYTHAAILFSGGNRSASATISLMPFSVSGTTIETYQNRVWIGNGVTLQATAPGTVSQLATSLGGVLTTLTDASLKTQITRLAQANGFLYGFGDSSVFSVTNVQTSSAGLTTYNISNVDPQVGTTWRDSVAPLGRALVFANPTGVYALYGGAAEKVSNQLDDLFLKANWTATVPTAAVATIYNNRVYMMNFTFTSPLTQGAVTKMAVWDGQRWFLASQLKTPVFIQSQEVGSTLSAWATDGTNLYQMYQTASTTLSKIFQSKLRKAPNYTTFKRGFRLYFLSQNNGTDSNPTFTVSSDTEVGSVGTSVVSLKQSTITFTSNTGSAIQFTGAGSANLNFYPSANINIDGFAVANYGRLLGYTVTTTGSDLDIISMTAQYGDHAPFG